MWPGGQRLCPYDTIEFMSGGSFAARVALTLSVALSPLAAQIDPNEPVVVFTEHPRIFLRPARLKLLRRERERTSERWRFFENSMPGSTAPGDGGIPEPGFAASLYYQVASDRAMGIRAVNWALGPGRDLRQLALVYDWCQDLMSDAQKKQLAARIQKSIADSESDNSISAIRSRALGAVALFDDVPQIPERVLERVVRAWWLGRMVPQIKAGHNPIPREDAYPLYEILHALRDNTNVDLREACPGFFKDFPIEHLMSYYPALYPAPENDYHIGAMRKPADPDLRQAILSRAADLAMVSYDTNAPESQVLQGWLTHDLFLMRGSFGIPYEFMWANPYQPGLSYYHVPLVYYNPEFGRLYIRSSWDDDAIWFGTFDGAMQTFQDGHVAVLNPLLTQPNLELKEATVCFAHNIRKFQVTLDEEQGVFLVGLEPRKTYLVEVDDEEMSEVTADTGGIVALVDLPKGKPVGIRLKELTSGAGSKE